MCASLTDVRTVLTMPTRRTESIAETLAALEELRELVLIPPRRTRSPYERGPIA